MAESTQVYTVCFYVLPLADRLATGLQSAFSSKPQYQLLLPTSEAELLSSPLFGHIDICVTFFTPPHIVSLIFQRNPVKWIHSFNAGVAMALVPEVVESEAPMTNSKGLCNEILMEFAAAGMLHFAKSGGKLKRNKEEKVWDFFALRVLRGKTVLVLGYGELGRNIGRMAKQAFGMRVIAVKRTPSPSEHADETHGLDSLPVLLPSADFVIMCLPDTPSTHHLISTDQLNAMKPSAVLINVGRGAQIDETALISHLNAGKIAGAALDVTEIEPLPSESPLWECPNLLLSPHCACLHNRLFEDNVEIFMQEFEGFVEGKIQQSQRKVDKILGY